MKSRATAGILLIGNKCFPTDLMEIDVRPLQQNQILHHSWSGEVRFTVFTRIAPPIDIQLEGPEETPRTKSYGPSRKGRGGKVRRW
jgi:hypothetical protein